MGIRDNALDTLPGNTLLVTVTPITALSLSVSLAISKVLPVEGINTMQVQWEHRDPVLVCTYCYHTGIRDKTQDSTLYTRIPVPSLLILYSYNHRGIYGMDHEGDTGKGTRAHRGYGRGGINGRYNTWVVLPRPVYPIPTSTTVSPMVLIL